MNALIIGGSGGLSGTLASMAKETYEVWALTRGSRPMADGIHHLVADRNHPEEFRSAILKAGVKWDVVFDCICMNEVHARQDLELFPSLSQRLVLVSTDSVYDPARKQTPQNEEGFFIEEQGDVENCTYAGNKRKMERAFFDYAASRKTEKPVGNSNGFSFTLFRPGHIYGPGFLLGCYPEHSRQTELPDLLLKELPLSLVASGIYLIHPVFVRDLAQAMLDCVDKPMAFDQVFCIGGPEAVENRTYYEILGKLLGKNVTVNEIPLTGYSDAHPEFAGHLCHRMYDLSKLKNAGIPLPKTSLTDGLRMQLMSLGYCIEGVMD